VTLERRKERNEVVLRKRARFVLTNLLKKKKTSSQMDMSERCTAAWGNRCKHRTRDKKMEN